MTLWFTWWTSDGTSVMSLCHGFGHVMLVSWLFSFNRNNWVLVNCQGNLQNAAWVREGEGGWKYLVL